jgi:hypothetical protein
MKGGKLDWSFLKKSKTTEALSWTPRKDQRKGGEGRGEDFKMVKKNV